jgi:hypothetical protein
MTDSSRIAAGALAMAARQADGSYLPNAGLFRDFILPDRNRSGNHRPGTPVTGVSG